MKNTTLQEFIQENNGKIVGNTPENMGQCVGLVSLWMDKLGVKHEWGNANDLLSNADLKTFDIIENTPQAIPVPGDIVVWNSHFNGTVGHTGIATGSNTNIDNFECFGQNDPVGSPSHLKQYSYAYIDGWMRLKATQTTPPLSPAVPGFTDQTKIPANFLGWDQDLEIQALRGILKDYKIQKTDLENARAANNQQTALIEDLRKQLANMPTSPNLASFSPSMLFSELVRRLLGK